MKKFKIGDPVIFDYSELDLFIDIVSNEKILHTVNENKFGEVFKFNGTLEQANEIIQLQNLLFKLNLQKDNSSDLRRIQVLNNNIQMMLEKFI